MLGLIKYIVAAVCALVFIICLIVAIRKFSKGKRTGGIVASVFAVIFFAGACYSLVISYSNPHSYSSVGDIRTPLGYKRVEVHDGSFASFLRGLPLRPAGTKVMLYGGKEKARLQGLSYAVIDMDILSNSEQCADACMRLWAEYLFKKGEFSKIKFKNVNGETLAFKGRTRMEFESFMKRVFETANTYSMEKYMRPVKASDVQIGDVLVYVARPGRKLGHAVIVVDMAENMFGNKVFLVAESNTPARDKHVMRNFLNPAYSPWFILNQKAAKDDYVMLLPFRFYGNNIRRF